MYGDTVDRRTIKLLLQHIQSVVYKIVSRCKECLSSIKVDVNSFVVIDIEEMSIELDASEVVMLF